MEWSHERAHFRIEYPVGERPTFTIGSLTHQVADASEAGIRYVLPVGDFPEIGERIAGIIRFSRGQELEVQGEVVRYYERSVALRLIGGGIPMRTIFDEQRYLRKKDPARYR